jgi:signal peptidase II
MNEATKIPIAKSGIPWLWVSVLVFVADQLTKLWIVAKVTYDIYVLPVLNIIHTTNDGAAWNFGSNWGGSQRWLFSALALGVSIALIVWLRRLATATHALLASGLVLIVGGALGNMIDRLRLGHVIDFIQVHWGNAFFPAFNVADAAISVGAGLVIYDSLLESWRERRQRRELAEGAKK